MKPADKAPGGGNGGGSREERGAAGGGRRCPLCGKPTDDAVRPFCSRRCADIDLGRWLGGRYVISGGRAPGDDGADEA